MQFDIDVTPNVEAVLIAMLFTADPRQRYKGALANMMGLTTNQVHHPVNRLVAVGVLREIREEVGGPTRRFLHRPPEVFYDFTPQGLAWAGQILVQQREFHISRLALINSIWGVSG
jgi:hypothetical protein